MNFNYLFQRHAQAKFSALLEEDVFVFCLQVCPQADALSLYMFCHLCHTGDDRVLNKDDYLAAGKFFDLRAAFPDLDYRAHDFRIDEVCIDKVIPCSFSS